jgi:hypothetical protein
VLGSVFLHAGLIALPLGSARTGSRADIDSVGGGALRAFLRSELPDPPQVPALPVAVVKPPPEAKPAPRVEQMKPSPPRVEQAKPTPDGAARESTSVAAIPATFFDPDQLSERPKPLSEPRLDLLLPMLGRGGGVAKLVLYIDETGTVDRVEVESATLLPAAVERAKVIFAALRFSPGRFDGAAVKSRVRITVGAEERGKAD